MSLPRVRFTVRRMMAAVAIAGAMIGGGFEVARLRRLAAHYRARACEARAAVWEGAITEDITLETVNRETRVLLNILFADMDAICRGKGLLLSNLPRLSVEPDPPEPE